MVKWKDDAVKIYVKQTKCGGQAHWAEMARELAKRYPDEFEDVKDIAKKVQDAFRTASVQEAVEKLRSEEDAAEVGVPSLIEEKQNKDGSYTKSIDITLSEATNLSDTDVMKICGYDPTFFKLVSTSIRKGSWNAATKDGVEDMYSYRITCSVKPIEQGEMTTELLKEALKEVMGGKKVLPATDEVKTIVGDKIAIVCVYDLHLGKLSWGPECGESYDHKIAIRRFNHIINESIKRLNDEDGIEKIVFCWSQDFFHYDTVEATTTAGTRQDTDVRWQKMFKFGSRLLVEAIQKLREIAPVETFYVRSNHDTQASYHEAVLLDIFFENDPLVTVDSSPSPRKYIRYGCNLLGFAHGDKEGKRISSMMPIEAQSDWGETTNHEFFLGHYHSLRAYEENGVLLRYLSSPAGPDAWHCELGFLGAKKAAQLFIRGKECGQIAEFTINMD